MPYEAFLATLSGPRSSVYKRVFRTLNPAETGGAVLWGQAMGMALQSLMLTFEVTLRNRIHVSLSRQMSEKSGQVSDSFPWYDHQMVSLRLQGATFDKVEALLCDENQRRLAVLPSPDSVVAKLSFGVWPNILEQQLPNPVIQARTFREVFAHYPKKPQKHWNHADNRKAAIDMVKDVKGWRNRIAHCKPVWTEGWFRSSATQHWSEVLDRVRSRRAGMLGLLDWMCPQTVQIYRRSYSGRLFDELATQQAVLAHIREPHVPDSGPRYAQGDLDELRAYQARR